MKRFKSLIDECRATVPEIMPWDLVALLEKQVPVHLLDVREPAEFSRMHIANSINVPRGILEPSCDWGYEETLPELVNARDKTIIVICRSGNRSLLAAQTMQIMGYTDVRSLQTGLRGWNDYEQPLVNEVDEIVDLDDADAFFTSHVRPEQLEPR